MQKLLTLLVTVLFISCKSEKEQLPVTSGITHTELTISSLSVLPAGDFTVGCFYYLNEADLKNDTNCIFAEGVADTAYMRINTQMVKFISDSTGIKNDSLEIIIDVWDAGNIGDLFISKGVLQIKKRNGQTTTVNVIGYCGC